MRVRVGEVESVYEMRGQVPVFLKFAQVHVCLRAGCACVCGGAVCVHVGKVRVCEGWLRCACACEMRELVPAFCGSLRCVRVWSEVCMRVRVGEVESVYEMRGQVPVFLKFAQVRVCLRAGCACVCGGAVCVYVGKVRVCEGWLRCACACEMRELVPAFCGSLRCMRVWE